MSTFLQVISQQSEQNATTGISISRKSSSIIRSQFEKYKQELQAKPGLTLFSFCRDNGLSYDTLRGYASRNGIRIRNLVAESRLSQKKNNNGQIKLDVQPQQICVMVKIRNTSFDISGLTTVEQLSTLIERVANHV